MVPVCGIIFLVKCMPNNIYNNLSDDQLKAGYWYVTHRVLLRKLGIFILAILAGSLLVFGIKGIIDYYGTDASSREALLADISKNKLNQQLLVELNNPSDLQVLETEVIKTGENMYDLYTEVYNPNQRWYIESFDYYFILGDDEKTEIKTDFVLPEQTKYVLNLGFKSQGIVNSANLIVENVKWLKVFDYEETRNKFLNFSFENIEILAAKQSGLSKKEDIANMRFDVINKSAYNFWQPRFVVFVLKRDKVIAVTQTILDSINSGEQKTESLNIFQAIPRGVDLKIVPDINILNPDVFKSFEVDLP